MFGLRRVISTRGLVSSLIYDWRDEKRVLFSFLDEDVPRVPTYAVYISQLIRFAKENCLMLVTSTT